MKPIVGPGGKLRGYIRKCGDRTELLAPGGMLLGYYNSSTDQTLYPGGKLYSYGYCLVELLGETIG